MVYEQRGEAENESSAGSAEEAKKPKKNREYRVVLNKTGRGDQIAGLSSLKTGGPATRRKRQIKIKGG